MEDVTVEVYKVQDQGFVAMHPVINETILKSIVVQEMSSCITKEKRNHNPGIM